jgi:hypothetical protein
MLATPIRFSSLYQSLPTASLETLDTALTSLCGALPVRMVCMAVLLVNGSSHRPGDLAVLDPAFNLHVHVEAVRGAQKHVHLAHHRLHLAP